MLIYRAGSKVDMRFQVDRRIRQMTCRAGLTRPTHKPGDDRRGIDLMRVFLLILASAALSACVNPGAETPTGDTGEPAAYERISFAGEKATTAERAICEAAGGEVRRDGLAGWEQCIQTPPDAGQACSDSSDCLDRCMLVGEFTEYGAPATGQCSQSDSPFGCFQTVENGRAEPALCVD